MIKSGEQNSVIIVYCIYMYGREKQLDINILYILNYKYKNNNYYILPIKYVFDFKSKMVLI